MGAVTNVWDVRELRDVLIQGHTVYLSLAGSWFRSRTYLCLPLPSDDVAHALVHEWGWSIDGSAALLDPPVLTEDGEVFSFNH